MNCALFLLAVIPSHIHGFYISWTYFFRRRKVTIDLVSNRGHQQTDATQAKKGRYPGGPKPFIYSQKVINGGLSNAAVEELWRKECGSETRKKRHATQTRRRDSHMSGHGPRQPSTQQYFSHDQTTAAYHQRSSRPCGSSSHANPMTQAHEYPQSTYR